MTRRDLSEASAARSLAIEAVSLLSVFSAAFLAGQAVASRTGGVWWGVLAGSLVFVGIFFALIWIVNRLASPGVGAGATPGGIELAALLFLFLSGDLVGRLVVSWTGSRWWGLLAGAVVVGLLLLLLLRLFSWAKARPSSLPSPQEDLAWTEPRAFRRGELDSAQRWVVAMIIFTIAAGLVFLWLSTRYSLGTSAPRRLLVAVGGIIALFLGLLGITRLMRIVVRITAEGIIQELGEEPQVFRFETIDHCEIGTMIADNGNYRVLVAELKNGDRETFCLDPSVPEDRIRSALDRAGVVISDSGFRSNRL